MSTYPPSKISDDTIERFFRSIEYLIDESNEREFPGQLLHTTDVLFEKAYVSSSEYEEAGEKDSKKPKENCRKDESTNVLSFTSGEAVTIGGTDAATVFSATSFAASGSLDDVSVTTVANANAAINAIAAKHATTPQVRACRKELATSRRHSPSCYSPRCQLSKILELSLQSQCYSLLF